MLKNSYFLLLIIFSGFLIDYYIIKYYEWEIHSY